jgi:uncharacterized protein YndB with AHSA1/START domain
MADIKHSIQIDVPPPRVFPLLSSGAGLARWWAEDMSERFDGVVDLGFFARATVYSLKLGRTSPPSTAEWRCQSGKEWQGTKLTFELIGNKGLTLLRFAHSEWEVATEYFVSCNTTWGALMFRLKRVCERDATEPLFSSEGWAL